MKVKVVTEVELSDTMVRKFEEWHDSFLKCTAYVRAASEPDCSSGQYWHCQDRIDALNVELNRGKPYIDRHWDKYQAWKEAEGYTVL